MKGVQKLKKGTQCWLTASMRQSQKLIDQEVASYEALPTFKDVVSKVPKIDLLVEIFAGTCRITDCAQVYGLSVLQPFEKKLGYDLTDPGTVAVLKNAIRKFKPLCVLVEWPCTRWCLFNENMNYSKRLHELELLRRQEEPVVKLGAWACNEQSHEGRLFLGENPLRSRLWELDCIRSVEKLPDTH